MMSETTHDKGVRMGGIEAAWAALDGIRQRLHSQEMSLKGLEGRVDSLEKNHVGVHEEIRDMRHEISEKLDDLIKKKHTDEANAVHDEKIKQNVAFLMAEHHQQSGRKQAVSWLPVIVATILNFIALGSAILYLAKFLPKP
jgi:small-conductance mechanosensitive channel